MCLIPETMFNIAAPVDLWPIVDELQVVGSYATDRDAPTRLYVPRGRFTVIMGLFVGEAFVSQSRSTWVPMHNGMILPPNSEGHYYFYRDSAAAGQIRPVYFEDFRAAMVYAQQAQAFAAQVLANNTVRVSEDASANTDNDDTIAAVTGRVHILIDASVVMETAATDASIDIEIRSDPGGGDDTLLFQVRTAATEAIGGYRAIDFVGLDKLWVAPRSGVGKSLGINVGSSTASGTVTAKNYAYVTI